MMFTGFLLGVSATLFVIGLIGLIVQGVEAYSDG